MIACEDTRHTGQLIKILNAQGLILNKKYVSVRDWNEAEVVDRILMELQNGDVALVSDAGTPLISDPGYKVVRAAREAGFTVSPIPGPSAVIAALSASGLPTNKFMFLGFLPKKWGIVPEVTTVIYESPVRVQKTVEVIKQRYPKAQIVIARELTKMHEKIGNDADGTKGEVTIVTYLPK